MGSSRVPGATTISPVLYGRVKESDVIDRALRAARGGRGGALVLHGEAGAGRTALLEEARASALRTGMRVLTGRGVEGESELPYAALSEVCTPLLGAVDAIPAPQAAALRGALALAPPAHGDRFAVAAGMLSLLATAGAARPVAVLVDDLQWVDPASAEALLFAARRLSSARVCLLAAVREDDPAAPCPPTSPSCPSAPSTPARPPTWWARAPGRGRPPAYSIA